MPSWVKNDMKKMHMLDKSKNEMSQLMHKTAKNFFVFAEKNKQSKGLIGEKRKQSIVKIKEL